MEKVLSIEAQDGIRLVGRTHSSGVIMVIRSRHILNREARRSMSMHLQLLAMVELKPLRQERGWRGSIQG